MEFAERHTCTITPIDRLAFQHTSSPVMHPSYQVQFARPTPQHAARVPRRLQELSNATLPVHATTNHVPSTSKLQTETIPHRIANEHYLEATAASDAHRATDKIPHQLTSSPHPPLQRLSSQRRYPCRPASGMLHEEPHSSGLLAEACVPPPPEVFVHGSTGGECGRRSAGPGSWHSDMK